MPVSTIQVVVQKFLQMDQSVPVISSAALNSERDKNFRWNFSVNLLDGASFWFGLSFISSTTVVPLFISQLTDSTFVLGIVAMIAQGAWFLPQLFTANWVERLARKKPIVVRAGFFLERMPMWLIVLAAILATRSPVGAVWLFLFAYGWHGIGAGVVATAWQDMIARCFPVEKRGLFFGTTLFVGAGAGAGAAGFSAWLLETVPFPQNFVYSFFIAAIAISVSWGFLSLTREPIEPVTLPSRSNQEFLVALPQIFRSDINFRYFLGGRLLLALGGMGIGFLTIAAIQEWNISNRTVGLYTLATLLGQTFGNLGLGILADRAGHKLSLELSSLFGLLGFMIAWLAPAAEWYFVVFFLLGVSSGGVIVSGILIVLEFSPPQKRPTYAGLANTAIGLVSIVAPLLGAGLVIWSYSGLFALSGMAYFFGFLILRFWVQEPRLLH